MATENKREEKKHSIAKEPYKKINAKKIKIKLKSTQLLTKDRQLGKKAWKTAHSEERREPSNTLNRTEQNNTEQELSEK